MPLQVMLPSGRVTTVDTDDPKVAAATARAFIQRDPYESARVWLNDRPGRRAGYGGAMTVERAIPFLTEAGAGLTAGLDTASDALKGRKADFGKNWTKERAFQQAEVDAFKSDHPNLSTTATAVGNTAPIAAALLSGGLTEAPTLAAEAPSAARGVAGFLQKVGLKTARRATVGAGAGYVGGASQPGTLRDRAQGGNRGAAVGAVAGTILPPVLDAAGGATAKVAGKVGTTLSRVANRATGGGLLDPTQVAAQRLTAALKADGATPDLVRQAMNGFLKNGATDPALIDVASRIPSGGQFTLALVRGAAAKGAGRNVAAQYADQAASDLQDKAIARTTKLTPDTRPASVVREKAVDARSTAADREYGAPYAAAVDAGPVLPALEGNTGRRAITAARGDADALRLGDQMTELDKLRAAAGPEELPVASIGGDELAPTPGLEAKIRAALGQGDGTVPVSLGTLDRTKIALNEAGRAAAKAGNGAQAKGLFERADEIDQHLADANPDYATARDNYSKASAGIDALDHGATGLSATPDEFAGTLDELKAKGGEPAGEMAGVGYRQSLTDALGAPTEGAKGTINRVATSTNQGRNLEATFGADQASTYRAGLKDLATQGRNADFINPNTGSQTAGRLADLGLVEPADMHQIRLTPFHMVLEAVNKVRRGAMLTDAEREAITRIGTSLADPDSIQVAPRIKLDPNPALDDLRAYMAAISAGQDQGQKRVTAP